MNEISVLNLFLEAGPVVKSVMLILLLTSILTWIVIIERYNFYKKIKKINSDFLSRFWSGKDLHSLYNEIPNDNSINYGSLNVFRSAFDEFNTLSKTNEVTELDLEGINRSMRVAIASDEEQMNVNLSFLANVGSVGTVWGIMTSFQGLSDATQATINAVAPGISEALVATAMGLFAAIPAVLAYNKFASELESISQSTVIFSEELASIFYKQTLKNK
jgi:biopolymer transport protein TolQ